MPELPEVETVRRQLGPRLTGRAVLEAGSHWSAKFTPAVAAIGTTFIGAGRRGKYLLLPTSDDRELVIHLGMTGQLSFRPGGPDDSNPYLRAWWQLDQDETLEFSDVRRFGRIRMVPAGDYTGIATLSQAGPEPWDPALTPSEFHRLLSRSKRRLKTSLLSQRPIAGVGNIYADEALWHSQINPKVTRLGLDRAAVLLAALQDVLEQGIENGGTTLRDYRSVEGEGANQHRLVAYGRSGLPCLRCETEMKSEMIDARTTTWCPNCQRR